MTTCRASRPRRPAWLVLLGAAWIGCGDGGSGSAPPVTQTPVGSGPPSVTIPLEVQEIAPNDHRIGIVVSVGGGPPAMLLFDTGSSGCFVDASLVGAATPAGRTFKIEYGSGQTYKGDVLLGDVALGAEAVAAGVECGAVSDASPALPLPGGFQGTLGMSLVRGKKSQGGLYSLVAQLPGNLSSGFIVGIGGSSPSVTVGLTDAERATFATRPLPAQQPKRYPNGVRAWNDKGTKVRVTIDDFSTVLRTVFDTGAVNTELIDVRRIPDRLLSDLREPPVHVVPGLSAAFDIPGTPWTFTTGTTSNDDYILRLPLESGGTKRLNTGLGIYFSYDVMFDIERGRIGFRPVAE